VNGEDEFHAGEPDAEMVYEFAELSAKYAPDTELKRSDVLVIAVSGAVGAVKLLVYSAVPTKTRMFVIYPVSDRVPSFFWAIRNALIVFEASSVVEVA
jgi:hypothetical protein